MAVVFLEGGLSPNTNANGERQTPSWTPSPGMSIRTFSNANTHRSQTQFVAESSTFSHRVAPSDWNITTSD